VINDLLLDDIAAMAALDSGNMMEAVASSGAQMREAVATIDRTKLAAVADGGKPRAVLVAGVGGSGVSGDVLMAVAGPSSSIPITVERTHILQGWASPLDLVIAVSCSGETEETLSLAAEAARRGTRLVTIGAAGSSLEKLSEQTAGAIHFPINAHGRMPRASLWTITTPLLMIAAALEICDLTDEDFAITADAMDQLSADSGPSVSLVENEAKSLGLALAESFPMVWGSGGIGRAASNRFMAQLAENSKLPSMHGALPEVGHNQIVTFDGIFAKPISNDDIFRDRVEEQSERRLKLVLLRDEAEHEAVTKRVNIVREIVADRSIPLTEMMAHGHHRLTRIASLVVPTDWASVYAAFAMGIDPSPIGPINQLKAGLAK
jgi:glucose/mannose-6-phosphate isomerase